MKYLLPIKAPSHLADAVSFWCALLYLAWSFYFIISSFKILTALSVSCTSVLKCSIATVAFSNMLSSLLLSSSSSSLLLSLHSQDCRRWRSPLNTGWSELNWLKKNHRLRRLSYVSSLWCSSNILFTRGIFCKLVRRGLQRSKSDPITILENKKIDANNLIKLA